SRPRSRSIASSASSTAYAGSSVVPTAAPFRNSGCRPTPTGSVSYQREMRREERIGASRVTAKSRCAARSPTLLPSATATLVNLPIHQFTNSPTHQLTNLFDPSCRQHFADGRTDLLGAPAQEICPSRERLLEKALVLEGLAQDDAQHAAVAGFGHRLDA